MAYIYKITNQVNQKSYIGKTSKTIEFRWLEHLREANKPERESRPLYRAIKKYGQENFKIEEIEQCSEENVEEREVFWIKYYETYEKGYNATLGGDGKAYLNRKKILEDYLKTKNIIETARLNNCGRDGVKNILHNEGIETLSGGEVTQNLHSKRVLMLDKETGVVLQEFPTYAEAARYLKKQGFTNVSNPLSLVSKLSLVCRGKRKSCSGFGWKLG